MTDFDILKELGNDPRFVSKMEQVGRRNYDHRCPYCIHVGGTLWHEVKVDLYVCQPPEGGLFVSLRHGNNANEVWTHDLEDVRLQSRHWIEDPEDGTHPAALAVRLWERRKQQEKGGQ